MEVHKLLLSHAATTENHLFGVKCDHVHGHFTYTISMYCEIALHNSYGVIFLFCLFCLKVSCSHPRVQLASLEL